MLDQGVRAPGERTVAIRVTMMEFISCLNDVVELAVELASECGVETFLNTPSPCPKGGDVAPADFNEAQELSSSLAMSVSSGDSSRQLAFNRAWRQATREKRGLS